MQRDLARMPTTLPTRKAAGSILSMDVDRVDGTDRPRPPHTGRSAVEARPVWDREVAGSIPAAPTLHERIEAKRADRGFQERLRRIMTDERELLERLAR